MRWHLSNFSSVMLLLYFPFCTILFGRVPMNSWFLWNRVSWGWNIYKITLNSCALICIFAPHHVFIQLFIIPIWTGQGTNNGCYLWHIKRMDESLDGWRLSFTVDNRSCNNKLCPHKNLYMNAQGSIFHNSQNVEIIQMVIEITQITHQGTSDCSKCDIAIKWNIICTEKVILSTDACY